MYRIQVRARGLGLSSGAWQFANIPQCTKEVALRRGLSFAREAFVADHTGRPALAVGAKHKSGMYSGELMAT